MVPPRHMGGGYGIYGLCVWIAEEMCPTRNSQKCQLGRQSMGFKACKLTEPLFMGSLGNPD